MRRPSEILLLTTTQVFAAFTRVPGDWRLFVNVILRVRFCCSSGCQWCGGVLVDV